MVARALRRFANGPVVKFVSNIDAADLDEALHDAHPETTLFVISSKTFTTLETMHNAERARQWTQASISDWASHFVAATSHAEAALNWGIQKIVAWNSLTGSADVSRCRRSLVFQ